MSVRDLGAPPLGLLVFLTPSSIPTTPIPDPDRSVVRPGGVSGLPVPCPRQSGAWGVCCCMIAAVRAQYSSMRVGDLEGLVAAMPPHLTRLLPPYYSCTDSDEVVAVEVTCLTLYLVVAYYLCTASKADTADVWPADLFSSQHEPSSPMRLISRAWGRDQRAHGWERGGEARRRRACSSRQGGLGGEGDGSKHWVC